MTPYIKSYGISQESKFGGVALGVPLKEFNEAGFKYGDSLDLHFSNGESVSDVPYYDNFYSPVDAPLVCGFPTFAEPRFIYNMTRDAWLVHHLKEGDFLEITVCESGKYLKVQTSMHMYASNNREDFADDATFANFRAVNTPGLKPGNLCRGASPCDLEHNRNSYTDKLMKEAGVKYILSFADSAEELQMYHDDPAVESPYFKKLFEEDLIYPVNIGVNYRTDEYKKSLGRGLVAMSRHQGPYMVYCSLGKDRTGFCVTLLAGLMGATYKEVEKEYMITYKNFYGIDEDTDAERYNIAKELLFTDMIKVIAGKEPEELWDGDLEKGARRYLAECGLTDVQIQMLKDRL